MRIIGLAGPKGVGKSTTATLMQGMLSQRYNNSTIILSLADPIKDIANVLFPGIRTHPKNMLFERGAKVSPFFKDPRSTYQFIGTELFRSIDKDFWIKILQDRLTMYRAHTVIIDDVRFDNEVKFIQNFSKDSIVYRLTRPGVNYSNEHASETLTPLQEWLPLINLEVPGAIEQAIGHG